MIKKNLEEKQYSPSSTWEIDALRAIAEMYLAVIHLFALSERTAKVNIMIEELNFARRTLTQVLISQFPNFNGKLTCAVMKHIPSALHLALEVLQANPDERMEEVVGSLKTSLTLGLCEATGTQIDAEGCYECLQLAFKKDQ